MRAVCAGIVALLLAGCGANGAPEPVEPVDEAAGTASIGVAGDF